MTLQRPIWMQAGGGDPTFSYAAVDLRSVYSAITFQEGVFWGLGVTQRGAGANFSVDVGTGQAVIAGDDVAFQGHYMVLSDAVANVVVPAAPVSGSRVHRVIARVKDKVHNGAWTTYEWTIELLEDTGTGTPSLPGSAINLALVTVSSTTVSITSAEITDNKQRALLHPSMDENVASTSGRPANPVTGQRWWRTDVLYHELFDGSAVGVIPNSLHGPAWTTWTPVLTANTTNPTLGTGSTITGSYMRVGRNITARCNIKFGSSGVNPGSGTYHISLPVTPKTLSVGRHVGSCWGWDASATNYNDGVVISDVPPTTVTPILGGNAVTSAAPWTWAANDELSFALTYEAAS